MCNKHIHKHNARPKPARDHNNPSAHNNQQTSRRLQADSEYAKVRLECDALKEKAQSLMRRCIAYPAGQKLRNRAEFDRLNEQARWHIQAEQAIGKQLWLVKWKSVPPTVLAPLGEVGLWFRVGRVLTFLFVCLESAIANLMARLARLVWPEPRTSSSNPETEHKARAARLKRARAHHTASPSDDHQQTLKRLQADLEYEKAYSEFGAWCKETLPFWKLCKAYPATRDQEGFSRLTRQAVFQLQGARAIMTQVWVAKWRSVPPTVLAPLGQVGLWSRVGRVLTFLYVSFWTAIIHPIVRLALRMLRK